MRKCFLPYATLLLRAGAAAQHFVARKVQHEPEPTVDLDVTLAAQVWTLHTWQLAACSRASDAAARAAQDYAPPELLQDWLQCTLASLRLLQPRKPGGQLGIWLGRLQSDSTGKMQWAVKVQLKGHCASGTRKAYEYAHPT